jgi:putative RecB family exonuclease
MAFANTHLSFSRLQRFEQCPLSFKLHYVDKRQAEPGIPLRFGKAVHAVLEGLVAEAIATRTTGPLSEARVLELWGHAWAKADLVGVGLFAEGLAMLKQFVRDEGVLEPTTVLAIEKEFRLQIGGFTVLGFMDRVNWLNDETLEIVDYKTNHQLFTRDEVDASLQMSLYELAARQLWPWVKNVRLTFLMIRHGIKQTTSRSDEDLEAAKAYVATLGRQTETATTFPARLHSGCTYCDHRAACPAYAEVLDGSREIVHDDLASIEQVAVERERVATRVRILQAHKTELEKVIKAHLKDRSELVVRGVRYAMFNVTSVSHPLASTVQILSEATQRAPDEISREIAVVDNDALKRLMTSLGSSLPKPRLALVRAELEANAEKTFSPRFWAKEVA